MSEVHPVETRAAMPAGPDMLNCGGIGVAKSRGGPGLMPRYEIVATSVVFGEGPSWCADGTVVCTSVSGGCLYRIFPEDGHTEVVALTGGGPNSCVQSSDGGFVVTQNGGIDFSVFDLPEFGNLPPCQPVTPGIQYVSPSGETTYLASQAGDGSPMRGPNDLVVAEDGSVYFTDPGHYPLPARPAGRVMKLDRNGDVSLIADGFSYCNGIAIDPDGSLVIVERQGLMRLEADGSTQLGHRTTWQRARRWILHRHRGQLLRLLHDRSLHTGHRP